jgi:hypothetical protein
MLRLLSSCRWNVPMVHIVCLVAWVYNILTPAAEGSFQWLLVPGLYQHQLQFWAEVYICATGLIEGRQGQRGPSLVSFRSRWMIRHHTKATCRPNILIDTYRVTDGVVYRLKDCIFVVRCLDVHPCSLVHGCTAVSRCSHQTGSFDLHSSLGLPRNVATN